MGIRTERVEQPIDGWKATNGKFTVVSKTEQMAIDGVKAVQKLADKQGGEFKDKGIRK